MNLVYQGKYILGEMKMSRDSWSGDTSWKI